MSTGTQENVVSSGAAASATVSARRPWWSGRRLVQGGAVLLALVYVVALAVTWIANATIGEPGIYRGGRWHEGASKLTVTTVAADSPLSELREGDSIVAIDGKLITDSLMYGWFSRRPGDRTLLTVEHGPAWDGRLLRQQEDFAIILGSRMSMPIFVATLLIYPAVGLMAVLVSVVLGILRPMDKAARLLIVGEMCYAYALLLDIWGTMGLVYVNWLTQAFFVVFVLGTSALLHLSLTFPIESPVLAWLEKHGPIALRPVGGLTFVGYLVPLAAVVGFVKGEVIASNQVIAVIVVMLMLSMVALFRNYRRAKTEVARAQLRWMIVGLGIGVAGMVLSPETGLPFVDPGLYPIAVTVGAWIVFPGAVAMAILRYRLFDIDVIINRSLVYGLLTAMLAAVYFGGVVLLQPLFQLFTNRGSDFSVAVSTLVTALSFNPLRHRVQTAIDQRFFRHKYDAVQTLAAFGAAVRDEVDLTRLTQDLLNVVQETMEPSHLSVWLAPSAELAAEADRSPVQRLAA